MSDAAPPAGPIPDRPPRTRRAPDSWGAVAVVLAMGVLVAAIVAFAAMRGASITEGAGTIVIERAEWALSWSERPPDEPSAWRETALPLRWAAPEAEVLVRAWFRLRFERPSTDDTRLAVFIPKLGNGGSLWLNGVPIGDVQTMDERTQVRWFRPFLFPFRAELLREGTNELVIRQQTRDERNVFRGVVVGPLEPLRHRHEWLQFWQKTTATIAAWFCMLVGLFLVVLWARRRDESLSAIFGVACLMWSLRSMSFVVESFPLEIWFAWRTVYYIATGGFIAMMAIGLARFAGRAPRWLMPVAVGWWAAGPLLFVAFGWPVRDPLDQIWILGFLPFMIFEVGALAQAWWREREGAQLLLLGSVVVATGMALHDYVIGLDPQLLPKRSFFGMHLAAPIVLAALGAHLLDRFVRSLEQSETLARNLEQRVTARERELASNFAKLRLLERERALADERQRIMREMHDGVGSQLLTSLAMVERGAADRDDVARMLRECLDDMRLAIDTLTPESADLGGALGNLRYRSSPRFEAMGVRTRWNLASLPDSLPVTPHQSLQLLRIVQESLANVLKHARAGSVQVSATVEDGRLVLEVADDGVGFDDTRDSTGRGLRNMRRRAAEAGATLDIGPREGGGTRVRIARSLAPDAPSDEGAAGCPAGAH